MSTAAAIATATNAAKSFSVFMNTHKEQIKNGSGYFSIAAAPFACYDLAFGSDRSVRAISADVSLIINAGLSREGVAVIGNLAHRLISSERLIAIFGPNGNFVTNPYHPRHVASIVSAVLMLPTVFKEAHTLYRKVTFQSKVDPSVQGLALRLATLASFFISRVFLHVANQQLGRVLKA